MKQSRIMSLVESVANVIVGYGVAVVTQILIFPVFGLHTTLAQNLKMGAIFTVLCRARHKMVKIMAIADYEDRFAIPTAHREQNEAVADIRGGCGFTDGNGCSTGETGKTTLFGGKKKSFALPMESF